MKTSTLFAVAALVAAVAACGKSERAAEDARTADQGQATQQGQVYSGTGKITAIVGDQVTIAHGPIEGIGWPAMTMSFTAPPGIAEGLKAGDNIAFQFRQDGGAYALTAVTKQ